MYRVLVHHRNEYGEEPEVVVDVPGVMTILGSYSDFCDGYALMCTNTQGLRLAISRREDNTVKVYNHTIQDRKKFQLSGLKCKSDDKWISTVKAVFIALQHDGITLPGMDISITGRTAHSDYDTLAAAVAAGFLIAFNDLLSLSLSLNDMLRIAHAANAYSNGSSRLRDLLTLFIIKKKELVLFDLESYNYETMENPFDTDDITTYILDCGIPKNILYEEERKVQQITKDTMELLKKTMEKGTKLRDYSTRELKYQRGLADENALRYANFTLSESSRVLKAWDALQHSDRNQFSKILLEQQDGIYEDLEVTSPEVEWLIKRANENPHVYASSLISMGLSGHILIVGERGLAEQFEDKLSEYERIFDFHATLRPFSPTGGVRILRDDDSIGQ